jgi:N-carbamoyl-L-amino-acid hydrolase
VATVGSIAVAPGAVSVIPSQARLALDMRAIASDSLSRLESEIRARAAEIAARRRVTITVRLVRGGEPVALDPGLAQAALAAAELLKVAVVQTWSGAGHDAQHLAALMPTLLLFVPLEGGESHTPQEDASRADILNAALIACAALGTFNP